MATRNATRTQSQAGVENKQTGTESVEAIQPVNVNIHAHIAQACPKLAAKIKGQWRPGMVFHTVVNKTVGKPDCNLTTKYCDELEAELSK